jgi:hypothetical protein
MKDLHILVKENLKIEKDCKLVDSNNKQELDGIEKMKQELVDIQIKKDVNLILFILFFSLKFNYYFYL